MYYFNDTITFISKYLNINVTVIISQRIQFKYHVGYNTLSLLLTYSLLYYTTFIHFMNRVNIYYGPLHE